MRAPGGCFGWCGGVLERGGERDVDGCAGALRGQAGSFAAALSDVVQDGELIWDVGDQDEDELEACLAAGLGVGECELAV